MSDNRVELDSGSFVSMCAQAKRFKEEIPLGSLVGVFCTANKVRHNALTEEHLDLQFNLVGIAMLATPYGQGGSD